MGSHGAISCNRVTVAEAGIRGNSIVKHHVEIQNEVNDVGIREMWQSMYEQDSAEPNMVFDNVMTDKLEKISYEDKRFLRIINEQTIKVGDDYQTLLSLHNPAMMSPKKSKNG